MLSIYNSMKQIPPDHVGIVRNLSGGIRPYVFHSSEIALIVPWWEQIVLMREKPAKKRMIKEFKTMDGETIEARLLVSIQAPIHWMPEVFYKFGRDFGRSFLEREAAIDFEEVCKRHSFKDLLSDGPVAQTAMNELKSRLEDAATFHRLGVEDMNISFVNPDDSLDEY